MKRPSLLRARFYARGVCAALCALAVTLGARVCEAVPWRRAAAFGHDQVLTPGTPGNGWVLFDLRGVRAVRGGDFHLQWNTDTLHVALEGVRLGARVELSAGLRGQALIAGVLTNYVVDGQTDPGRGFFASYGYAFAAVKWLPGGGHVLEGLLGLRRWAFSRRDGSTRDDLVLPPDTWVFEPRVRYTWWAITSAGREWGAEVFYPRWEGVAASVEAGLDLRADARAWGGVAGQDAPRNRPGTSIFLVRQSLRAGRTVSPRVRLQLEQHAAWGRGEDDLTRVRAGGLNPYVVAIPGVPWAALLSERLVAAQASVHLRPSLGRAHEVGVALAGGAFNDVHRTGRLDVYGGALGVMAFADLRFGRWQGYTRVGYGLPLGAFAGAVRVSVMVGLGASF